MPLASGMTGKDVAEKMLHDNGIYDVDNDGICRQHCRRKYD